MASTAGPFERRLPSAVIIALKTADSALIGAKQLTPSRTALR